MMTFSDAIATSHPAFGHPLSTAWGEGYKARAWWVTFSPPRGEKVPKADEGSQQ